MADMKKYLFVPLVFIFTVLVAPSFAGDYETEHTFQDGDVISADMINELFDAIEKTKKETSITDVVGTWQCRKYIAGDTYPNMTAYYTTPDADGLWHYLDITLEFIDDGDGTYSWSSQTYNAFTMGAETLDDCNGSGNISAYNGKFALSVASCPTDSYSAVTTTNVFNIQRTSGSRIDIIEMGAPGIQGLFLVCDKQNLPPSKPTSLSASASGSTVTLSWTDASTDETGFKIVRKDSEGGSYAQVGTASAGAASYSDTLTSTGTFWYRVKATNSNGDSTGSNVVKVTVE